MKEKITIPSYIYARAKGKEKLILKCQYGGPSPFLSSPTNIENSSKAFAKYVLKGLGKIGDAFTTIITAGGVTDFGLTSPFVNMDRQAIHNARVSTVNKAKETITKTMPIISPTSWTIGLVNKGGPWKGAEIISQQDPRLLMLAAGIDLAALSRLPRGTVKSKPLDIRLQRILNKLKAGIIPETDQTIIIKNHQPKFIIRKKLIDAYKKLGIEEADAIEMADYNIKNNGEGVHVPVADDNGNLIGGISYVDKLKAIELLRKSGIKNPTESDISTVVAHEVGHQIETPGSNKEFYTRIGLVLDNEGITAANPKLTVNNLLDSLDRYLALGRLDNGISDFRESFLDMPINTANKIVDNINKFSAGTGVVYTLSNKKDKIDISKLIS